MYKHTVKSKLSQARSTPPLTSSTGTPQKQPHALGAGKKFFSHIRHKIEDNLTPKLSGKLYYKGSKHTRSMSALSLVDTGGCVGGKYTPTGTVAGATAVATSAAAETPLFASSNPLMMSSSACSYVDSDDESQLSLSLSLTQQSLEDEIFAELEKVAHDESKLNEVLQSFDQILQEYPTVEEPVPLVQVVSMIEPLESVEQSLPPPPAQFCDRQLLSKSHSTLSMATSRRQIYQTPELANSMLLRRSNSSSNQRYNSLCELSQLSGSGSRIPIPISKHSSLRCLEKHNVGKQQQQQQQQQAQRQHKQQRTRSMLTLSSRSHSKSHSNSHSVMTVTTVAATLPPKRANSTLERRQLVVAKPPRRANSTLKSNVHSDELLVKCLAKGHELLRKVETLNGGKPRASRGVTKEHTQQLRHKKKQQLQKLQYANEEKVRKPKLESCKIIPPKLGETSDKNHELLVKVVQQQQQQPPKKLIKSVEQSANSDSDDSGHISNTVLSSASNSTSNSTGSLCESEGETDQPKISCCKPNKIAQLLQKFEAKSKCQTTSSQMPMVVTKVAQVQAVRCIQTQVEIYPTYTKEVTMRLH
ncbi:uncharacterized protein LOC117790821 [Drosophila innubila]|uniref:uncharacterized protein LOC117790821 n=1 Tax=Drosophila innubila TaxID=198719 RepID=UPI00148DA880|nr:uncharacterized protein LOC117790821 [Drosophila innubila]